MKYSSRQKFPNYVGKVGLYTLVALCLVVLGAVAWVVVARNTKLSKSEIPSTISEPKTSPREYDKPENSYNETTEQNTAEIAEKTVSDVPYSESAETETQPNPPAQAFQIPLNGDILKNFSDRELQPSATYNDLRLHEGIDIAAKEGANVCSAGYGTVTTVEEHATLGKTVVIDHRDGIILQYCGLDSVQVAAGDAVEPGQLIGTVGIVPSECADEAHLHLAATKNGEPISPLKAIGLE